MSMVTMVFVILIYCKISRMLEIMEKNNERNNKKEQD